MSTDRWGIDATYEDAAGTIQTVSKQAIARIRTAIGRPSEPARSLYDECVKIVQHGESFPLPAAAELKLEDGTILRLRDRLPHDLPIGYHQLISLDGSSSVRVIVSPGRCHLPPSLRIWGWSVQVYAVRSRQSWGMGDLADLRHLAQWSKDLGARMVLINPLHAASPVLPQEASPYSPSSRRYLNPLYLRIEELPGAAHLKHDLQRLAALGRALNEERHIDRDRVFVLKQEALELLWSRFEGDPAFEQFRFIEGRPLHEFAVFCALAEEHGANWRQWPHAYRRADSRDVEHFAHTHADRIGFHAWLQWLLNLQLAHASKPVSLMQDLPIGFSPDGADAWVWQDFIAADVRIGAPPDLYNHEGQNWGLPPFIPHRLQKAWYEPFIQTIRAVLRHAGGLRIDHVMGLFRLWWVPQGRKPKDGAFVRYCAKDLLAIIAIESQRAGAVVVGEDLGTVEPGVREKLAEHNILSYRLLWFEDTPPSQYPEKALAAITTHDLPTLVGVWTGMDLEMQRNLGLAADESANENFREKLRQTSNLDVDADVTLVITKTFEQFAQAPSAIVMASMEAACVSPERPNMPAARGKYPNWSLALPLPLEDIESSEVPHKLATILNGRGHRVPMALTSDSIEEQSNGRVTQRRESEGNASADQ
jgi:4-alpha-glucanotransferase